MAIFRRLGRALIYEDDVRRRRKPVLELAAADFLSPLRTRRGKKGGKGYAGWELSNVVGAAFWCMALLSQRRERFPMQLLSQIHEDTAAVTPFVREKKATQEILDATSGIDADSLVGFADVAISRFQPPGASGEPLVPAQPAHEILRAALLRGAMAGHLQPQDVRDAWIADHPEAKSNPERHWRTAQGKAESLYRAWQKKRGPKRPFT